MGSRVLSPRASGRTPGATAHIVWAVGLRHANYSGTYGVYNNASSISDSKYKYYMNFWGRGDNFYNNYYFKLF